MCKYTSTVTDYVGRYTDDVDTDIDTYMDINIHTHKCKKKIPTYVCIYIIRELKKFARLL